MSTNIQEAVREGSDIIDFLLKHKFSTLSYDEKQIVRNLNKPCPDLVNLLYNEKRGCTPMFSTSWYQKCQWISGNITKNRLYCWYCLLFCENTRSPWNSTGYNNLKQLAMSIQKHEISKEHVLLRPKISSVTFKALI
jgi:hypothetical protein